MCILNENMTRNKTTKLFKMFSFIFELSTYTYTYIKNELSNKNK